MEILKTFFRSEASDYYFKMFSITHFLFLLIGFLGIIFIVNKKDKIKTSKKYRNILVYTLFVQQILLYFWYIESGYFSIQESLPFYNCRLAILSIILGEFLDRDRFRYLGMYWGLMGSVLALLFPVLDPFGINHFTFYSFFIGHLFLLWGSFYFLVVQEIQVTKTSLRNIYIFTNIYHIIVFLFDFKFKANYCYLLESPILTNKVSKIPQLVYTIIAIIFFDFAIYITHFALLKLGNRINNKTQEI